MSQADPREELLAIERERWPQLVELLNNARFLASGRAVAYETARASLDVSRARVVLAMKALREITPRAIELFSEPAYKHIDDHLPEIRRFLRLIGDTGADGPSR